MTPKEAPLPGPDIDKAWTEFVDFLKERDARITQARRIVFYNVMERHDHFRADDLANELAAGTNRVSRGTVYRTLNLMVDAGMVRTINDGDTHFHYEHIYGHPNHEHMICDNCGCFVEFRSPDLIRALEARCREFGFEPTRHNLTVFGYCANCKKHVLPEKTGLDN